MIQPNNQPKPLHLLDGKPIAKPEISQAPTLGYGDIAEVVDGRHGDSFIWEQGKVIDVPT